MTVFVAKGAHEALVKRLDPVIARLEKGERPHYGMDDLGVFCYIRSQITPEGRANRHAPPEDDTNILRLHDVAKERLSHYEKEASHG